MDIFIICNSPAALNIISSGDLPDLDKKNLFTCNNAYTFFKTMGRHLNFWTDTIDIFRKVLIPEALSDNYQDKVEHIFSPFGLTMANGNMLFMPLRVSPVNMGASTALGALAFLSACERYEKIYLVGYTLNEEKNSIWLAVLNNYIKEEIKPFVFRFTRK